MDDTERQDDLDTAMLDRGDLIMLWRGERVRASQLADALEKLSTYAASLAKGYTPDFAARVLESVEKSRSLLSAGGVSSTQPEATK